MGCRGCETSPEYSSAPPNQRNLNDFFTLRINFIKQIVFQLISIVFLIHKQILASISKSSQSSFFFVIEYFREFTELSKICVAKEAQDGFQKIHL